MATKWKDSIKSWKKEYDHIRSSMQCFFDIYVVHAVHAVQFVKVTRRSLDKVIHITIFWELSHLPMHHISCAICRRLLNPIAL